MRDVCVLCGKEGEALGPPPHAHLSCVAEASAKQRIQEIHGIDFHSPGSLFPSHRAEHKSVIPTKGDKVRRDKMGEAYEAPERDRNSPRTRLHPAVFETYYQPIAQEEMAKA